MSMETTEGIEEIQEDVAEKVEALDKKLRIHLPRKQPSYSIVSSRQSSFNVAAASNCLETERQDVPQDAKNKKNDKNLGTYSSNKEKVKSKGKKQKKLKALQKKVQANKKLKDISDKNANVDDYDEEYESEPDVSEIVLIKPKVESKTEATDEDDGVDKPKSKPDKKKKRKKGTKKSVKRKKSKMFSASDQAASEIERLLAEKDKLLRTELAKLDPNKAPSKPDSSFYPPPKNLEKRRCYFHRGAKALKCTVCSGGKSRLTDCSYHFCLQFITGLREHSSQTSGSWQR